MTYSDIVKAAVITAGKKQQDVAAVLEISPQAFRNKLNRNSFSCADLVTIAAALGYNLAFVDGDGRAVVKFKPEEKTEE